MGGTAINLRQLRYFAKIVEVGNITRAAEQLYVAQPALGLQIRTLEQDLGVTLLVRHSRGVTPTKAGQVLYERACEILRAVQDARKEVAGFAGQGQEQVVLGLTPGVMNLLGQELLVSARDALPNVNLSLIEEMSYILVDALEREEIDLAFAYSVAERPGLVRIPIIDEELLLVTAPDGKPNDDTPVPFAEALKHPLALAKDRDSLRSVLVSVAEGQALVPNVAFEASSIAVMKNLVASGVAASVMPYGSAINEMRRGTLKGCRIENPSVKRTLYLVRSTRRAGFKHEPELLEFVRAAMLRFADMLGPLARKLPSLETPFPPVQ